MSITASAALRASSACAWTAWTRIISRSATRATTVCTFPRHSSTWCRNTSAATARTRTASRVQSSVSSAARTGRAPRRRRAPRQRILPRGSSRSTPNGSAARVLPSRPTPRGKRSLKRPSTMKRPTISSAPSPRSRPTWSARRPWIACSAAMSATVRPRSRCAP